MQSGAVYYRKAGLKPIVIYIPEDVHAKLLEEARQEENSLQVIVKRILQRHTAEK